jgi:hypothetical protein
MVFELFVLPVLIVLAAVVGWYVLRRREGAGRSPEDGGRSPEAGGRPSEAAGRSETEDRGSHGGR